MTPKLLRNRDLRSSRLPTIADGLQALMDFAHTFDGYGYWGDVGKCADIANSKRHNTLTELRTCLFFEARRQRHGGTSPTAEELAYMYDLVEQVRARVSLSELLLR
jgi:hypothetical protein